MSYTVHGSQPSQNWNGGMYNTKKRKRAVVNPDLRSTNSTELSRKPPSKHNAHNSTTTPSNSNTNQFLIDGTAPTQPCPQLLAKKAEVRPNNSGPGRHRSVDLKGLIMELIDEIYPPLVCPTCLHIASGRSEADAHFKNEHHGTKVFECVHTKCDQAYSSKPGLRYHLEHAHKVTLVSGESYSRNLLKNNKKLASLSISPSSILLKNNSNNNQNNSSSSSGENTSKKLKKQELSSHLQEKLDRVYDATICPACKEQFKRKTHVIRHLVDAHHGEEPYKCVVSNCKRTKTYATREGLVYHLLSYHDEMQR